MGLTADIEKAFLKSIDVEEDSPNKGKIPQLSKDLSKAIITFLQLQTFTITELKAFLEVEEISTNDTLQADILDRVTYVSPAGTPTPLTGGSKGVLIPAIKMSSGGGQGGSLKAFGHAYIGKPPKHVHGSDTTEEYNEFTKVKLVTVEPKTDWVEK